MSRTAVATWAALPTSVWMRMYALTAMSVREPLLEVVQLVAELGRELLADELEVGGDLRHLGAPGLGVDLEDLGHGGVVEVEARTVDGLERGHPADGRVDRRSLAV